jgi:hypothetical protein
MSIFMKEWVLRKCNGSFEASRFWFSMLHVGSPASQNVPVGVGRSVELYGAVRAQHSDRLRLRQSD